MEMLFRPGKIGKLEIKNRLVMVPMGTTGLVELDGRFSQRAIDYYVARAKGGTGLIETSVMMVDVEIEKRAWGPWSPRPRADSPVYTTRLNELADAVHDYGAKIAAQLTAGFGRTARGEVIRSGWAIAPSAQPCFWDPKITARGLSVEEIERLIRAFGVAGSIIKMAEFDAIDLHGHEGYLIDQFMTSKWNKRTDKYGGDLEGRLRFPLEIIESIRKAVGPDFPLIFRMAGRHYLEGARELNESIVIARRLEEAGIDCLSIDAGCYESWQWAHPPIYMDRGCSVDLAAAIKKEVGIPVIAAGRLGYPELAEKVLEEGKADFIGLGRPLLADPEWPSKVKGGQFEEIRPCIGDHDGCMGRPFFQGKYISCSVNPQAGMEREFTILPASCAKSVLVIGGGPGGMEAARVAALRGHRVTLWEKTGDLGGNLIPASIPAFKSDIKDLIVYLSGQIRKLKVQVELNKEATLELVKGANADEVIVATGATPLVPKIQGCTGEGIVTATDLLLGKRQARERVVVIGGGIIGCETALWLAQMGKKVTIVEMLEDVMADVFPANKQQVLLMLAKENVMVVTGAKIQEVTETGVSVEHSRGKEVFPAETVALAVGLKPEIDLIGKLKDANVSVHAIGDCAEPRNILSAIWEGFRLALRI